MSETITLDLCGKPTDFTLIGEPVEGGTYEVDETMHIGVVRLVDLPWSAGAGQRWLAVCGEQQPWVPSENPNPNYSARTGICPTAQLALDALIASHAPLRDKIK